MPTFSYPSDQFPGPPAVTIDLPEDWSPVPTPGALLAARGPAGSGPAPTLVVRHHTRPAGFTVDAALKDLRTYATRLPDSEVDEPFSVDVGGVPFVGVNLSWSDARNGDVVQVHLFAGGRQQGLVHLVHVTGTVGGSSAPQDYDVLQGILRTVRVER